MLPLVIIASGIANLDIANGAAMGERVARRATLMILTFAKQFNDS
jgi:hypothetical protein